MSANYLSVEKGVGRRGLRVVLTPGLPGPWGVAAKAVLDFKSIQYASVAQSIAADDKLLREWTGQDSAPAAMLDDERPRTRWDEIILLAQRLKPDPSLVPADEAGRAEMFGLLHAIAGEDGFGWNFRLHIFDVWEQALRDPSAEVFLTREQIDTMKFRYGDPSRTGESGRRRMRAVLKMLADRLRVGRKTGSRYFLGGPITALDLYWTAFSNLVAPMSPDHCPMPEGYRAMGNATGAMMEADLDPILIEHREHVLQRDLRTPLVF